MALLGATRFFEVFLESQKRGIGPG